MTRELVVTAKETLAFREVEPRALQAHEVRVRMQFAAAKHGTEMAFYKGYAAPRGAYDAEYQVFMNQQEGVRYPFRLGNIGVGEVIETGAEVTRLHKGDRVFNFGSFSEEHIWPDTVWALPDGVPWQAATCLDPADFALGAVRDGHVRIGDAVAVFGMGAIGLMALQIAKLAGAYPVIAVDPLPLRRQVAQECGADFVLNPAECDAGLEIKKATHKRGADVCIEYSGSAAGLQAAIRGVAYEGTVVAGAFPPAYPAGVDFGAEAHMNRPRIIFSQRVQRTQPGLPQLG